MLSGTQTWLVIRDAEGRHRAQAFDPRDFSTLQNVTIIAVHSGHHAREAAENHAAELIKSEPS